MNGTSWVTIQPLRGEFFWLCLRVSYVPHLQLFSVANLRRMQLRGKVRFDGNQVVPPS